jgi:mercuric reductase
MAEQHVEWNLQIEGMTCDHCASTLDQALRRVPGVAEAATVYEAGTARVVAEPRVDAAALEQAVAAKGYRVTASSARPIGSAPWSAAPGRPDYVLAIVGTGSAGVAAAIRAAELGATVAIIERGLLGGTCVNIGCVPSKTLIRAAEVVHRATHHGFVGVRTRVEAIDFGAIVAQKDQLVAELRQAKYADVLAGYPSITLLRGAARFRSDGTLEVDGTPVRAGKYLLATGASPWAPPIPGLSDTRFLTSTEALALQTLPASLVVVGGSAVGLEIAQLYARLGTRVTVLEAQASLVPAEDAEIGGALTGYLRDEGIAIETGAAIQQVAGEPGRYRIQTTLASGPRTFEVEQLLVATGRRPNTRGMGLDEVGIQLGKKGEVVVDEHLETTRPGVYAAGDTIGDPAFVYVAAYAGSLAAENALGTNARRYDLSVVPRVTFTDPAIASVGLTEAQARARGIEVAVSRLPMSYVPRAIAARDTRGMIKLVADRATNLLVGAHILAPEAGDLIQEAVMAIQFGIRVDQITTMLHPYLTNAEAMKLACQTFDKDVAKLSCCA